MLPAPGSLLIASATLRDPHFARSLVLVLDANEDGALAVILNRPTETPVGAALPGWQDLTTPPGTFFTGGPVEGNAALALGLVSGPPPAEGWRGLRELPGVTGAAGLRLGLVDLDSDPADWVGRLVALRAYAGYAGWASSQLDAEIAEGSWHLTPSLPSDLFSEQPGLLWREVLRRQPAPVSMLSTLPEDVSLN